MMKIKKINNNLIELRKFKSINSQLIHFLEEYGINKEEFFNVIEKMTHDALESGSPQNTIKEVNKEDISNIYKSLS